MALLGNGLRVAGALQLSGASQAATRMGKQKVEVFIYSAH